MNMAGTRRWLRRAAAALVLTIGVWTLVPSPMSAADTPEVRALWVLRSTLTSPEGIATLVKSARANGFNTLFVQVRGRADAYYQSRIEPRAPELARQPDTFDPLRTVLDEAHRAGLRVHAWMNLNLVSSAAELPIARDHLVYRHPEWLMVPRPIAQTLATVEPDSPAYAGMIARWTRTQPDVIEGLYASPINPAAAAHAEAVVSDVARRYPVDGIHLDYARYPNAQYDYSRFAIAAFRAKQRPQVDAALRRELDAREAIDLFAWPDQFPEEWARFRRARLTGLMMRLHTAVKAARPTAVVTVAAAPDAQEAFDTRLQDWRTWLENGVIDAVCPMAYTPEPARFAEQIAAARDIAGGQLVWAGIGAYRLTPAQTIENIRTVRRLGAGGFILFSYDSLTAPQQGGGYLDALGPAVQAGRAITEAGSR